jgi:hypothetical protein
LKGRVDNRSSSSLGKTTLQIQDLVENHRIPPKHYYVIKSRQFQQKSKSSKTKRNLDGSKGASEGHSSCKKGTIVINLIFRCVDTSEWSSSCPLYGEHETDCVL